MRKINPGMQLWWNQKFAVVDFFKKKYGEPVECLKIEKSPNWGSLSPNRLITICTSSGKIKKRFSEAYFKTSPD